MTLTERIAVFLDFQNVHLVGRSVFEGIDVAIAVDLMHLAFRRQYDAMVLFSSDTDLLPALETVVSLGLGHVEVACWAGFKPLRFPASSPPKPWCHSLSKADWQAVTEDWQGRV